MSAPGGPWFAPIALEEVLRTAELQTRVDRKYLVPRRAFAAFERGLAGGGNWAELEIGGRRGFAYSSVYFDTPDLLCYRQHAQGRRRRFKVRTRGYLDSGTASFEVKMEGARSATVKERTAHPADRPDGLTPGARDFLAAALRRGYGIEPPGGLRPAAETRYRRRTLVHRSGGARLTLDDGLVFRVGSDTVRVPPGWVLAESKSAGGGTPADRLLRSLGVRPRPISKYCLAVMCLYPGIRGNPWRRTLTDLFGPEGAPRPIRRPAPVREPAPPAAERAALPV
ncbi:polyphosphate polymerase domain-containing protein [Nocardiopsis sp. CNT-189]|uniref:polyphosphate polymerase domain-containing protein n=1 Tax=Nocardiopsis oceanisediminis TaxID=2816862 RepID=UPI003B3553C3